MSKGDNSPGISKLAGAIKKVAEKGKDTSLLLDFGTIMEDYSLLTNTYPIPIPASDYLVCRNAVLPESEVVSTEETTAEDNPHSHGYTEQSTAEGQTGTVDGHSHPVTIQLSPASMVLRTTPLLQVIIPVDGFKNLIAHNSPVVLKGIVIFQLSPAFVVFLNIPLDPVMYPVLLSVNQTDFKGIFPPTC